jgi:hypothetical protein
MELFEFVPPEGSCHIYVVKADYLILAMNKLIKWQEPLENKWPEKIVKDESNWSMNMSTIFIE